MRSNRQVIMQVIDILCLQAPSNVEGKSLHRDEPVFSPSLQCPSTPTDQIDIDEPIQPIIPHAPECNGDQPQTESAASSPFTGGMMVIAL